MTGPLRTEVLIVGGGIAGAAAALALRRAGVPVVLLDREPLGSQASGVNFGGVRQLGRAEAELPLARRSRRLWDRLGELIGEDGEFRVVGNLRLAFDETEMAAAAAHREVARAHGLDVELLDRPALAARFPWIGPGIVGGMFLAEDGYANPRRVSPAFGRAARAAGAEILEREEAVAFDRDPAGFRVRTAGGREIVSRVLVNAAGAWGGRIAAAFGDPDPVTPKAPQVAVTEPVAPFLDPVLGVPATGGYLRQDARGTVIFGAGHGRVDGRRARPVPEVTLSAIEGALRVVPGIARLALLRVWCGVEAYTPDDLPVLGPSPAASGLVHAFGFSGHGFQLGPAVGEVVAELTTKGRSETPIDAFRIERFADAAAPRGQ